MQVAVKVLEGLVNVEDNQDYSLFNPSVTTAMEVVAQKDDIVAIASPLLPSIKSRPLWGDVTSSQKHLMKKHIYGLDFFSMECYC